MASHDVQRSTRVAARIEAELTALLQRGAVRDPRARDAVVSAVRVSADLSHARIYMRKLTAASEPEQVALVDGMERASGFLRRELARTLGLRRVPELAFFWDDTIDVALRMETILHELREEAPPGEDADDDDDDDENGGAHEAAGAAEAPGRPETAGG